MLSKLQCKCASKKYFCNIFPGAPCLFHPDTGLHYCQCWAGTAPSSCSVGQSVQIAAGPIHTPAAHPAHTKAERGCGGSSGIGVRYMPRSYPPFHIPACPLRLIGHVSYIADTSLRSWRSWRPSSVWGDFYLPDLPVSSLQQQHALAPLYQAG